MSRLALGVDANTKPIAMVGTDDRLVAKVDADATVWYVINRTLQWEFLMFLFCFRG